MNDRRLQTDLLLQAGRLLLEYNESTAAIHCAVASTAKALTDEPCTVAVSYGGVAVSLAGEAPALAPIKELRYNMAVQTRVHEILEQVRRGDLDVTTALGRLNQVEVETARHSRWLAAIVLGAAAASLARLLGADLGAAAVAAVATALGLLVRQELGRRHFNLLVLPLTAALVGSLLGGLAIQFGWTRSPELVLIVPALMLVPGPHFINALFDLIDNYLPMSLSRLGLALGILLASALGIVVGIELAVPDQLPESSAGVNQLTLLSDVILAGIATCGFALFYNTPWRHLWMALLGGMAGHGLRFLALDAGWRLEAATFLGGLTVGAVAAWMARSTKAPVAVIAFAGAVTMIPGLSLYRALGGAVQLARLEVSDPKVAVATLSNGLQGCLVVSGLALGVIVGSRMVLALAKERTSKNAVRGPHVRHAAAAEFADSAIEDGTPLVATDSKQE